MTKNRLTLIADKYNTDKGSKFGHKHNYTEIYDEYFSKYIGKSPNILEIGVFQGASLKMYHEYFVDCEVYAIDIVDSCVRFSDNKTHIYIFDAADKAGIDMFKRLIGNVKFDIIIDDGSHEPYEQYRTLIGFFDLLTEDGIYIIEDIHSNILDPDNKNCPLKCLPFRQHTEYLTDEENDLLLSKLDKVMIYSRKNNSCPYYGTSITAILTFINY